MSLKSFTISGASAPIPKGLFLHTSLLHIGDNTPYLGGHLKEYSFALLSDFNNDVCISFSGKGFVKNCLLRSLRILNSSSLLSLCSCCFKARIPALNKISFL